MESLTQKRPYLTSTLPTTGSANTSDTWDYIHIELNAPAGDMAGLTLPLNITLPPKYQFGQKCLVELVETHLILGLGNPAPAWVNPNDWLNVLQLRFLNQLPCFDKDGKPEQLLFSLNFAINTTDDGAGGRLYIINRDSYVQTCRDSLAVSTVTNQPELWLELVWVNPQTGGKTTLTMSQFVNFVLRLRVKLLE